MVRCALWVRLEAKPGKVGAVEAFLKSGLALANQEPATTAWFAVKIGPSTFAIFDAFPDAAGRDAHLNGPIAAALMANVADLWSSPASIWKWRPGVCGKDRFCSCRKFPHAPSPFTFALLRPHHRAASFAAPQPQWPARSRARPIRVAARAS